MNILQIKDLKVSFTTPHGEFAAVDGVSFDIARGEVFGIVGESGSGKTLTALSILGLVPHPGRIVSGNVTYNDQNILDMDDNSIRAIRGAGISMVFQEPGTSFDPVFTIGSQLTEAISAHDPLNSRKKVREIAMDYLEKVHIKDAVRVYGSYAHQISGGMKQRVMIAMALVNSPDLLILDEPTTALDVTIQAQILSLLEEIKERERLSMLFISHDLGVISRIAGRVAVMKSGSIVETGSRSEILSNPREEYTIKLLESVKRLS